MEFIAVSIGVQKFSDQHFRLCVFAFDGCLPIVIGIAACFSGVDVCHSAKVGIALSFALMHSSTGSEETKNQGKSAGGRTGSDRSARFSGPARGKSRWIDII